MGAASSAVLAAALFLLLFAADAQVHKKPLKPTEKVVQQYEKVVAEGFLLTPEGWKHASRLWDSSDPYPKDGEIVVRSAGGSIGEDWVKGNRAQVETKWNDLYGRIDSALRYKPEGPNGEGIAMVQEFPLVCVTQPSLKDEPGSGGCAGEWKIAGPQQSRVATIPVAIRYVSEMRDKSTDPINRKNANRTIAILKRLTSGCGSASAC
jgi:hypothetical protein